MEQSDLSSWFAAVSTFVAVAVALWYSQLQRRDVAHDRLCDVHAWVEKMPDDPGCWKLVVENLTRQPIYRWHCILALGAQEKQTAEGKSELIQELGHVDKGIIPPGHHEFSWEPEDQPLGESFVNVTLFFKDGKGHFWRRLEDGNLKRMRKSVNHMKVRVD